METAYSNLVSGFTKLFSTIIHSTVWREDMHVKVVWVTMLALANRNGCVFASVPGLADASKVSMDQCVEALRKLSGPDKWSRTKTNQGKRIREIDGGWELLNYLKYREMRDNDERRLQTRFAVERHRQKKKAETITVSHGKPVKAQAEAEAEAEAEAKKIKTVRVVDVPEGFEAFWEYYPKKKSRSDAEKAWRKLAPSPELSQRIHEAVAVQRRSSQWQRDNGQFIPYAGSWLNSKRWEDGDDVPVTPANGNGNQDWRCQHVPPCYNSAVHQVKMARERGEL